MKIALDQYREMKRRDQAKLLIFRDGDNYVLFHRDAFESASALDLAIGSIPDGKGLAPTARFPTAALEANLAKLVAAGYRAAVLEQVQGPVPMGAPVERIVTEGDVKP